MPLPYLHETFIMKVWLPSCGSIFCRIGCAVWYCTLPGSGGEVTAYLSLQTWFARCPRPEDFQMMILPASKDAVSPSFLVHNPVHCQSIYFQGDTKFTSHIVSFSISAFGYTTTKRATKSVHCLQGTLLDFAFLTRNIFIWQSFN